jgi:hypothetical protein
MYKYLTTADVVAALFAINFHLDPKQVEFTEGHLCLLTPPSYHTGFGERVSVHAYYANAEGREMLMVTDATGRVRPMPLVHLDTPDYDAFRALLLALHPATGLLAELLDRCRYLTYNNEQDTPEKWQKNATRYNAIIADLYDNHEELNYSLYGSKAWEAAKSGKVPNNKRLGVYNGY